MKFGSPPYHTFALHLALYFARSESFWLHSRSALQCQTLSRTRTRLARLVPQMGKASDSNIWVSPSVVVIPKALAVASQFVVACWFVMLPLSSFQFCLLAPYCSVPLLCRHSPAPQWLAPYCYTSAGTLLLIVVGWHPLCPVAPLAFYPLRWFDPSSVMPCPGIALPPSLWSNALDPCNDRRGHASGYSRRTVSLFSRFGGLPATPLRPPFCPFTKAEFLLF